MRGYAADAGPVERVLAFVQVTAVDGRAYPLFGVLFGYGLARVSQRGDAALVRRRRRWLVVLGLGHAALLFSGDIVDRPHRGRPRRPRVLSAYRRSVAPARREAGRMDRGHGQVARRRDLHRARAP